MPTLHCPNLWDAPLDELAAWHERLQQLEAQVLAQTYLNLLSQALTSVEGDANAVSVKWDWDKWEKFTQVEVDFRLGARKVRALFQECGPLEECLKEDANITTPKLLRMLRKDMGIDWSHVTAATIQEHLGHPRIEWPSTDDPGAMDLSFGAISKVTADYWHRLRGLQHAVVLTWAHRLVASLRQGDILDLSGMIHDTPSGWNLDPHVDESDSGAQVKVPGHGLMDLHGTREQVRHWRKPLAALTSAMQDLPWEDAQEHLFNHMGRTEFDDNPYRAYWEAKDAFGAEFEKALDPQQQLRYQDYVLQRDVPAAVASRSRGPRL